MERPNQEHALDAAISEYLQREDIEFFSTHGWWLSPKSLPEPMIDELMFTCERVMNGESDAAFSQQLDLILGAQPNSLVRQVDYLSLRMEGVKGFLRNGILPRIAAHLAKTSAIRLFHDQLVVKAPEDGTGSSTVGWHSDKSYWRSCTSEKMLTAWVALHDMDEKMGPIAFWDGSHRWDYEDRFETFGYHDLPELEQKFLRRGFPPRIEVVPLKKGQFTFHHCRIIHGSYANDTQRPRLAYAIHFQDHENSFNSSPSSRPMATHLNDMLCQSTKEGTPDYSDPEICPQLWP